MVKMTAIYQGKLHCELIHGPSSSKLETDAPKDNQGKGERFSPTDLVGAGLLSCILTTMGMSAEPPRRIVELRVKIEMPASIAEPMRKKLEHAAHACPVHKSLHPDVKAPIEFTYV